MGAWCVPGMLKHVAIGIASLHRYPTRRWKRLNTTRHEKLLRNLGFSIKRLWLRIFNPRPTHRPLNWVAH